MNVEEGSSNESNSNTYNAALKLAAAHDGKEVDSGVEKRLIKKIDWYLMPLMCLTYALQYDDKVMIGHSAIFGLREDLDIVQGLRYSNCTMIFCCGFIIGCFPMAILGLKHPTVKVCTVICFLWGAVVLSTPAYTS
ncbi:Ff.00g020500.m01.CDS01 [Fusarium sp. VM40]|nr:Ff.00g020500.m01.CDS01 [Fusarium sp. VM40]